ncbi:putative DM4/DM12 family-like protein 26 [Homarus americanus]|uniref:Putative DM4/DM12 family-like protein 26 n=1 Tax=Homarus americanus TaxID=6706 RepID=A0A8J5TCL2_HOMAM|nr:putative DM4/DM12 family-like protein 26 [Homarus americanus]
MESQEDLAKVSLVEEMADKARFFVYNYNATTLVTTAGLALGLFFIVTAIALYYYYYATTNRHSYTYATKSDFVNVLYLLEEAWALYDIREQECRRRVVCEAHLPDARYVNKPVSGILSELLSQVTEDTLNNADQELAAAVRDLQLAAQYGRSVRSCQAYAKYCLTITLADVPHN